MKKAIALLLALAVLLLSASALAESPAETLVASAESLLFNTSNVTLSGSAVFFLDDVVFKTADATCIQDQDRSFWQLKLTSPRPENPEKGDLVSGFTIIGIDSSVWVMETMNPGYYKTATAYPQTTLLRRSVQLDLMAALVRDLAKQADTLLGEGAVTAAPDAQGGTEIRIVADENVSDLVNTAITLLYQYAASRYFGVEYDQISTRYMSSLSNYISVTQGILYTTEYMYLKQADVTVSLDAAGELRSVSGAASVYLQTGGDGEHTLDVTFRLDVSDRGTSKVEAFDPEVYGVVPANEFSMPENW